MTPKTYTYVEAIGHLKEAADSINAAGNSFVQVNQTALFGECRKLRSEVLDMISSVIVKAIDSEEKS